MNKLSSWIRAVWLFAGTGNKAGHIQGPGKVATLVLTQYHVQTPFRNEFTAVVSAYVFSSLKATGNRMAQGWHEQGDASVMWVLERWDSRNCYNKNRQTDAAGAVRDFIVKGGAVLTRTLFMKELEFFCAGRLWQERGVQQLTVMLFIDVKRGTEKQFRQINHNAMSALREDPGLLTFQFCQEYRNKTRFWVFKKFCNREALQYHLGSAAIAPVISFLQTSVKDPPFEKAYHHLIEFAPLHSFDDTSVTQA